MAANAAGNSARYAMSSALISTATHRLRSPYTAITRAIQYSVPEKYTAPVNSPRRNAWLALCGPVGAMSPGRGTSANATSSGVSATHATAGWPNLGKLRARSTPDADAST